MEFWHKASAHVPLHYESFCFYIWSQVNVEYKNKKQKQIYGLHVFSVHYAHTVTQQTHKHADALSGRNISYILEAASW